MFWWYFIIGCDGKICPPCRKWYPNCDCQHQVGQNLTNPSNKKIENRPESCPFPIWETGWHSRPPWLCMITASFKCRNVAKWVLWWFLLCFQFWRLMDMALCFDDVSIIGCDGKICHPPRKWHHNWGVAKWVLWCFLMCFQFWRLLVRALCFDDISSLDVMVRSVLLVGSGTPTVVACARLVKIWLTHQTKNWKQARVQSFILLKNWWTLGIHGCIW